MLKIIKKSKKIIKKFTKNQISKKIIKKFTKNQKKSQSPIQYGGLDEPSWAESVAALYIVYLGNTINSDYYKLIFILNGLSSSLAHSPFISNNNDKFQKQMNSLDSITIWYPLIAKTFLDELEISETDRINYLVSILILNYLSNNKIEKFIYEKLSIISIGLLIYQTYNKWDEELIYWTIPAILTKIYEKKKLFKIGKEKVRVHTLWHIIGSHMFKKIIEL
jgi:hypothetical protein